MRVEIHHIEDRRDQLGAALARASVRLVEPDRERALPRVWLINRGGGELAVGFGSAAEPPPQRGPGGPPVSASEIERIRTALLNRLGLAGDDPVKTFDDMLTEAEADAILA